MNSLDIIRDERRAEIGAYIKHQEKYVGLEVRARI